MADLLHNRVIASHTTFDRLALSRVNEKYALPQFEGVWLDTARVCRRAWTQFARKGYGLTDVASWCGIKFQHHSAVEDARAAGLVLLRAISDTGSHLQDWIPSVNLPTGPTGSQETSYGNPDAPLSGEVVVFTGSLLMPRREAADLAASSGCDVAGSVGKKTTILVVGDQDLTRLAGHKKSSKHRKAEELITRGQAIRIVGERDFFALVSLD